MNLNEKFQKQLTLQDRFVIEDGLNHGECIASIARSLAKDITTIAHIYSSHKDEIPCCMKSLYNYIDQGLFTVRNIDLPKKVKYRARKKKKQESSIDYSYRENRTYKKFQSYI